MDSKYGSANWFMGKQSSMQRALWFMDSPPGYNYDMQSIWKHENIEKIAAVLGSRFENSCIAFDQSCHETVQNFPRWTRGVPPASAAPAPGNCWRCAIWPEQCRQCQLPSPTSTCPPSPRRSSRLATWVAEEGYIFAWNCFMSCNCDGIEADVKLTNKVNCLKSIIYKSVII